MHLLHFLFLTIRRSIMEKKITNDKIVTIKDTIVILGQATALTQGGPGPSIEKRDRPVHIFS
jgi:hypothetical protein